jgi:hypothetical protein
MASTPILPFAIWLAGTNQNSVPANDNSLRNQILNGNVISQAITAQPGSPTAGDIYIIPASATGAQWATFTALDLAIYSGGTWYAFAPVAGVVVNVAGSLYRYTGSAWTAVTASASAPDELVNAQTGTTYTYVTGDKSKLVTHTNGSAIAGTLPQAGVSFPAGWWVDVQNRGAGTLTITPTTSTVDGAASLALTTGQGVRIVSDGTNYFTQRGMSSGSAATWGAITGTLSSQTDLQAALDAKGAAGIPQNSQSTAYTLVLGDANKHIYHPAADTTARTWTIPANSSVAFPIGTAVTFDNDFGAGALTIAITTDTLVLVGAAGSTGSRTLATGGQATAIKVTSTRWRISGVGLT